MASLAVAESPPRDADDSDPEVPRRPGHGSGRVLVLNASYEPINVCTMRRATVLLLKSPAEGLEEGSGALPSPRGARGGGRGPPPPRAPRGARPGRPPPVPPGARPARLPPPQDPPQGRARPCRLDLPVLRAPGERRPHRRPRDPAKPRRP